MVGINVAVKELKEKLSPQHNTHLHILTPPDLEIGTISVVLAKSLCKSLYNLSWSNTSTTSTTPTNKGTINQFIQYQLILPTFKLLCCM